MARDAIARLMRSDPDTVEVVATMRQQGRTWGRIALCFRKQIAEVAEKDAVPLLLDAGQDSR